MVSTESQYECTDDTVGISNSLQTYPEYVVGLRTRVEAYGTSQIQWNGDTGVRHGSHSSGVYKSRIRLVERENCMRDCRERVQKMTLVPHEITFVFIVWTAKRRLKGHSGYSIRRTTFGPFSRAYIQSAPIKTTFYPRSTIVAI